MKLRDLKSLLHQDIIKRNKVTPFIISIFFLISFSLSRAVVMIFPELHLFIKQYHIHHFYYGIALLFLSNWVALVSDKRSMHRIAAGLTGVGLGLIIDEVGLLLTCSSPTLICDYWHRITYDVVAWFMGLFFLIIYFDPFWTLFKKKLNKLLPKSNKK